VGKLIIAEDQSINMASVFKKPEGGAPAAAAAKDGQEIFPVKIRKIRVQEGDLTFADLSLIIPFATQIHRLTGVVIGTSSAKDARAQIDLNGQVDDYGTARIGGEINVFDPTGFTDVEMRFENLEMTNLTPYSGQFAGRKIDSGKLSLELLYKIDNGRLLGDNQIVVDRLKLGERVESPEAVNLPLDLAVALLEDRNGVIDIGLPVKGDLNNPEFSVGHLVWKAFVNLITKIVTSPFTALGALIGGETENLDTVAFEPGKSEVPPPEAEKLQQLAQAMEKRPQLKLVVQGRFSPQQDGEALRNLALRRALAAFAGDTELAPEEDPGPVDYSDPATQRRLEKMFRERFGRAALKEFEAGLEPPPEKAPAAGQEAAPDPGRVSKALFARLAAAETLPETALPALAAARAEAIVARLTTDGGIAAERVTTASPEPAGDEAPVTAKLTLDIVQQPS
jgi:outer membrane protein OmpA-like peptidoglycan-associated protein